MKVCVATGSRADYGLLAPLLRALRDHPRFELQVLATAMHLAPEFGLTVRQIEADGYTIDRRVEMLLASDTPGGVAKSVGLGVIGMSDALEALRPDLLVVLGDRFEMLAVAQAALFQSVHHPPDLRVAVFDESGEEFHAADLKGPLILRDVGPRLHRLVARRQPGARRNDSHFELTLVHPLAIGVPAVVELALVLVQSLLRVFTVFPVHSYVQLNSEAVGRVIQTYPDQPMRPKLRIILDSQRRKALSERVVDLPEAPLLNIVRSISEKEIRDLFKGVAVAQEEPDVSSDTVKEPIM